MPRHFGHPIDVAPGMIFDNRIALSLAGVHPPRIAGISGSQAEGCDSIVYTNGYEDDEDHWDYILYTGSGGRDRQTGLQIMDQELTRHNRALVVSHERSLPVRVSRGPKQGSPYAPEAGYRYDGLYTVTDWWEAVGKRGFRIYRFRLERGWGGAV